MNVDFQIHCPKIFRIKPSISFQGSRKKNPPLRGGGGHSMTTIYLSLRAQVAKNTFFINSFKSLSEETQFFFKCSTTKGQIPPPPRLRGSYFRLIFVKVSSLKSLNGRELKVMNKLRKPHCIKPYRIPVHLYTGSW